MDVAEIANHRLGKPVVMRYLFDRFATFQPGSAHVAIVQLPWSAIYTTNYDRLIEIAAKQPNIAAPYHIAPIVSQADLVDDLTDGDIPYYKVHGTIERASTLEGRLILTREDYRYYGEFRKPLFQRLKRDLLSRTFLFAGYSLADDDLRTILDDCREELSVDALPVSYALRRNVHPAQAAFWREKYNIHFLDVDASQFLQDLRDTWETFAQTATPARRLERQFYAVDQTARFKRLGDSFYLLRPADCGGQSKAVSFFQGAEPTWADIRDAIASKRDLFWTVYDALFPELADPSLPVSVSLVTGSAGTGKTTLLRSLAWEFAKDLALPVVVHVAGSPLDAGLLRPLNEESNPKRIIVVIHHAAEEFAKIEHFTEQIKNLGLPVSVLLEERRNQWGWVSQIKGSRMAVSEFEVGRLSQNEIEQIIDSMASAGCLGRLADMEPSQRVEHFEALAQKDLLVALRELTAETNKSFDAIVVDEYRQVPTESARRVYALIAALGQFDLSLRYETIVHALGLNYSDLGDVFKATQGVLFSLEERGSSIHNRGFRVLARHPVIAGIVFSEAAPDDEGRFELLDLLLSNLDKGFPEDGFVLRQLVNRREVPQVLDAPEWKRAFFERLAKVLPGDPFVLQHRSMLERDLGDGERAVRYAREALKLDERNAALQNTLGLAYLAQARHESVDHVRQGLMREADRLFEDGIRKDPINAFGYLGKAQVLRLGAEEQAEDESRNHRLGEALAYLVSAAEVVTDPTVLTAETARLQDELGTHEEAVTLLRTCLVTDRSKHRVRELLVSYLTIDDPQSAFDLAAEGINLNPVSWRLYRAMARTGHVLGHAQSGIHSNYEAALRYNRGDLSLIAELGAYLFQTGEYVAAEEVFARSNQSTLPSADKNRIRTWWLGDGSKRRTFVGEVDNVIHSGGVLVAIPENFQITYWRNSKLSTDLRVHDSVSFEVGFSARRPLARLLSRA